MARIVGEAMPDYMAVLQKRFSEGNVLGKLFDVVKDGGSEKWNALRKIYSMIDVYEYTPYPVDWTLIFTPIEDYVWEEIRFRHLPFWPQYPIGRYFADFADPIKKIVIECDGAQWHDAKRDRTRDKFMTENGWSVYRINGSDCKRLIDPPWEAFAEIGMEIDEHEACEIASPWGHKTAEGFVYSLKLVKYQDHQDERPRLYDLACNVVNERRSFAI